LIYSRPVVAEGQVVSIVQVARPLAERDRALAALSRTLIIASLLTTLIAFGIGWAFSAVTLRPIQRITQTARAIGVESSAADIGGQRPPDHPNGFALTRRVDYSGPNDEIGELATTFNAMLSRLQDAYQRLSQALGMQRNFVADVSHELRTPLTTVRGNLALLRRDPPLPADEQADILGDLVEESDRLIRLVNDLLILARADASHSLLHEPFPVRPVVEEACRQARQFQRGREITETVQDVTAVGDRDALKQVLLILLDNALKYSQGSIQVTAEAAGAQVVVCVHDDGPGMDADTLEHVFDRFYRGEAEPAVPGFGLGLPIAKALIEGQSGAINLESQPGRGSTVRVVLPLI
jgi:signal transduction histidine kinase